MIDWGLILILALGILLGGILFNKDFRKRFFVWFRGFLGGKKTQQRSEVGVRRIYQECPDCHGLGRLRSPNMRSGYRWEKCVLCNGVGEVEVKDKG